MSESTSNPSMGPMVLTFIAGAALGAVVMALTTPKSGPELRGDLKDLAYRAKRRAGRYVEDADEAFDDLKQRAGLAVDDLKQGAGLAVEDLRQGAGLAVDDLKRGMTDAAKDLRGFTPGVKPS